MTKFTIDQAGKIEHPEDTILSLCSHETQFTISIPKKLKETIAQLAAMTGEAADKAVEELNSILSTYSAFKDDRTAFVTKLVQLLKTIKAYTHETNEDLNDFREDHCTLEANGSGSDDSDK